MSKLVLDLTEEGYAQLTKLLNNQNALELVTRNAQAKFQPLVKATVSNLSEEVQKEAAKIVSSQNLVTKQQISKLADMVAAQNGTISELIRGTSENTAMIQRLSADVTNICKGMKVLSAVSWISLGLNAVNLGVSIWEYKVLGDRINAVEGKIQEIGNRLQTIENRIQTIEKQIQAMEKQIQTIENQMNELEVRVSGVEEQTYMNTIFLGKHLLYDAEGFLEKAEQGQGLWADAKVIVKKFKDYLSALINNLDNRNMEQFYPFIYQLLPVYAEFIKYCYQNFYEQAVQSFPDDGSSWRSVYEQLLSKDYRNKMYDYYFLNQKLHNKDIRDILNANFLLVMQSRCSIEDTIEKMELAGNKEYFELLQTLENQQLVEKAESMLPALEADYTEEEALQILKDSLNDNYGIQVKIAA